jgi:hypothetical protein
VDRNWVDWHLAPNRKLEVEPIGMYCRTLSGLLTSSYKHKEGRKDTTGMAALSHLGRSGRFQRTAESGPDYTRVFHSTGIRGGLSQGSRRGQISRGPRDEIT